MDKWELIGGLEGVDQDLTHTHKHTHTLTTNNMVFPFQHMFILMWAGNSATAVNGIYKIVTTACATRPVNTHMQ